MATETEEQLAWEARQRPRAGVAAILAALLGLAGPMWRVIGLSDAPQAGFLESLGHAAGSGPIGRAESVRIATYQFYEDHALTLIGSGLLTGLGLLALAWLVTFLAVAVRARRPEFIRLAVYITSVGAVLYAISAVLGPIGSVLAISDFLDGPRTVDDARDVGGSTLLVLASLLGQIGPLAVVAGLFLVSLNAMRVGLLTRFLGILGMISGGLTVFSSFFLFAPFIQAFWLLSLGFVFLGVGRDGAPPAWRTGQAEPWPSQREIAAQKQAARQPAPEAVEAQPVPAGRPHPSSKKRKRKRRD